MINALAAGGDFESAIDAALELRHAPAPDPVPPYNPLDRAHEAWRCGRQGTGKSYCRARCPRNAAYDVESEVP